LIILFLTLRDVKRFLHQLERSNFIEDWKSLYYDFV